MKTLSILAGELRFITKQGRTALLILLMPLIIMAAIAPAFATFRISGVNVGVLAGDHRLYGELATVEGITVRNYSDADSLRTAVIRGNVVVGITTATDADGITRITLLQDPFKGMIATEVALRLENKLTERASTMISTNLVDGWTEIRRTRDEIRRKTAGIPAARQRIADSRRTLDDLDAKVAAMNLDGIQKDVNEMSAELDSTKSAVTALRDKIGGYQAEVDGLSAAEEQLDTVAAQINDARTNIAATRVKVTNYKTVIGNRIIQLDSAISKLNLAISYMQIIRNTPGYNYPPDTEAAYAQVVSSRDELNGARSDLVNAKSDLTSIESDMAAYDAALQSRASDTSNAKTAIAAKRATLTTELGYLSNSAAQYQERIDIASAKAATAAQTINNAKATAAYATNFTAQTRGVLNGMDGQLSDIGKILEDTDNSMGTLLAISPSDLAVPQITPKDAIGGLNSFQIVFPPLVAVTVLLSCLLLPLIMSLRQQAQGIDDRTLLTGTGSLPLAFGRFLGNYIVSLTLVMTVIGIGITFFSLRPPADYAAGALAVMAVPATFIAFGLLLSRFIQKESTAILSVLIIAIPMIFLSGLILPPEFITGAMQEVAPFLPLSLAKDLFANAFIRQGGVAEVAGATTLLAAYFVISITAAAAAWKWRPAGR